MALSEGRKFVYNVNKFREKNFETKRPSSEKITGISLSGAQTEESLNSHYAQNKESVKVKFSLDTDHYDYSRSFAQQIISWAQLY